MASNKITLFGFEGGFWDLIALVLDHSLLFSLYMSRETSRSHILFPFVKKICRNIWRFSYASLIGMLALTLAIVTTFPLFS